MITWKSLICIALLMVSIILISYGALMSFAAGMSDDPYQSNSGCIPALIGRFAVGILGSAL